MKIIIWYKSWFVPKGFIGITLWPVIHIALTEQEYIAQYGTERLEHTKTHESIHLKQQAEMLVIFFYLWYGLEFLFKLFKYGKRAYMNLSFEKEAYENAESPEYLNTRKRYSWFKYL